MAPLSAKDIDTDALVELIRDCNEARCDYSDVFAKRGWAGWHGGLAGYGVGDPPGGQPHWANVFDLAEKLKVPDKVLRAKLRKLIDKGVLNGCTCGCRGDLAVVGTKFNESVYGRR